MITRLLLAVVFSVSPGALASAQTPSAPVPAGFDSRWTPYLGCWRVAQEQLGQATVPVATGLMVCVQPSGRSGVQITTTVDGKDVLEQTVAGDGTAMPLTQGDCQGTQISEWSRDGERLFTKVELHCAGRPARTISGITEMARGYWIDAQATIIDGDSDVRVRRYRRTSDPIASAAASAGAPMSIDDVIEASKKVIPPVLEAALVEAGGRFTLNSRALAQLADAGVSPNVIDLMVAQAYPDRFEVDRPSMYPSSLSAGAGYGTSTRSSSTTFFMGSSGYPYSYPSYDPYFNSYYYYSPFAYPYYWGSGYFPYRYGYPYGYRNDYNNYYYGYPGSIYSSGGGIRSRGTAQPGSPDSSGTGTVVATPRGYTRVRPSGSGSESGGSSPRSGSVGGGRAASGGDSGGGSSNGGNSGSSGNSGSNSGGGGSSSSSSSGGSSSSSGGGGRTAQPR